jgi:hypothetical protein
VLDAGAIGFLSKLFNEECLIDYLGRSLIIKIHEVETSINSVALDRRSLAQVGTAQFHSVIFWPSSISAKLYH